MDLLEKVRKGESLSEEEIRDFIEQYEFTEIDGHDHRWQKEIKTICKISDEEYYAVDWMRGLTEYQEHSYDEQPYKVKPVKKVVETIEWKRA